MTRLFARCWLLSVGMFVLLAAAAPARAQFNPTVTDIFGNTCLASQLIPFGGASICPQSAAGIKSGKITFYPPFLIGPDEKEIELWLISFGTAVIADGIGGMGPGLAGAGMLGGPVPVSINLFGSDGAGGVYGAANIFGAHNSGYKISDTAGLVAPGSISPGYNSSGGDAGLNAIADATQLFGLGQNQRLLFGLTFDYQGETTNFGASPLAPALGPVGSDRSNTYTLAGMVGYARNSFYTAGMAAYDWSAINITNNVNVAGATGSTRGEGYDLAALAGYIFPLFNSTHVAPSMLTKAPPKSADGYATLLDVSGHYDYSNQRGNSFTDSSGFVYGDELETYSDVGTRVALDFVLPRGPFGYLWMPYIAGTYDKQFGFSHTFDFPGDTLIFTQSTSFWRAEGGLNIIDHAGVKAGIQGFYTASADTRSMAEISS